MLALLRAADQAAAALYPVLAAAEAQMRQAADRWARALSQAAADLAQGLAADLEARLRPGAGDSWRPGAGPDPGPHPQARPAADQEQEQEQEQRPAALPADLPARPDQARGQADQWRWRPAAGRPEPGPHPQGPCQRPGRRLPQGPAAAGPAGAGSRPAGRPGRGWPCPGRGRRCRGPGREPRPGRGPWPAGQTCARSPVLAGRQQRGAAGTRPGAGGYGGEVAPGPALAGVPCPAQGNAPVKGP